jgi:hypothetical protein
LPQSIERFKAFMIPLTAPLGRSERRVALLCAGFANAWAAQVY